MRHFIVAAISAVALVSCSKAPAEEPPLAAGGWTLDSEASELSYVTIKAGEIAEINSFESFTGTVFESGEATIEIDLSSVSTGVDIRDERMRDILFIVADNPTARVSAELDPAAFDTLALGQSTSQAIDGTLSLKGIEAPFQADVTVTRLGANRVMAVSDAPVIVDAGRLELTDGLAQLQELAGLPSITPVVPVTFSLTFER